MYQLQWSWLSDDDVFWTFAIHITLMVQLQLLLL